jgi:hypothetical protein
MAADTTLLVQISRIFTSHYNYYSFAQLVKIGMYICTNRCSQVMCNALAVDHVLAPLICYSGWSIYSSVRRCSWKWLYWLCLTNSSRTISMRTIHWVYLRFCKMISGVFGSIKLRSIKDWSLRVKSWLIWYFT